MTFNIADYSEFQGAVNPRGQAVVIMRAHNGVRADHQLNTNRANAHSAGVMAVGLYQYLLPNVDAAAQAVALCATVGTLAPNEWLICDLEVGGGDQAPRWQAWAAVVVQRFGRRPWLYSGASFAAAHNLSPDWIAAYQLREPAGPHKLWQNTDSYFWPWGKADGSIYNGTPVGFLAAVGIGQSDAVANPSPAPDVPTTATPAPTSTDIGEIAMAAEMTEWCGTDGGGSGWIDFVLPPNAALIGAPWVDAGDPAEIGRYEQVRATTCVGKDVPAGSVRVQVTGGSPI